VGKNPSQVTSLRGVIRVDETQDKAVDLVHELYDKLGEAFDLAERLQEATQTNQELRQARKMATRIHRLRGDVIQLRHNLDDREK
jgi:hypothetical protein